MAAPINVTVTSLSESVQVTGASSESVSIVNGGGVAVAVGTVSAGDSLVTAGTVQVGKVTTLSPGSNATVVNNGTGIAAVLDFGIPAGAVTNVTVGNTTTLAAGSNATVASTVSGSNLTLAFGIPAGKDGVNGVNGVTPSFAIGTVSTLAAGSNATVTATAANSGTNVTLNFGIPQGAAGAGGSSNLSLSDATPSSLGTASAGTSNLASRADHVHAVPVISYASLTNVPSTFAPAAHSHAIADVAGLQTALDSKSATSHGHDYVTKVNNLTGSLTLVAGTGVTITPSGSNLTINAAGGISENDAIDGGDYIGEIIGGITFSLQPQSQTVNSVTTLGSWVNRTIGDGTNRAAWIDASDSGFLAIEQDLADSTNLTLRAFVSGNTSSWTAGSRINVTTPAAGLYGIIATPATTWDGTRFVGVCGWVDAVNNTGFTRIFTVANNGAAEYAPTPTAIANKPLVSITYGNGRYVVAAGTLITSSTDLSSWASPFEPTFTTTTGKGYTGTVKFRGGLAYFKNAFYGCGYLVSQSGQNDPNPGSFTAQGGAIIRSTDNGATWSIVQQSYLATSALSIAASNNALVAIMTQPGLESPNFRRYVTTDGTTWSFSDFTDPSANWQPLRWAGDRFLRARFGAEYEYSFDGATWLTTSANLQLSQDSPLFGVVTHVAGSSTGLLALRPFDPGALAPKTISTASANFTVAAAASSGNPVSYQWERSLDAGGTWSVIANATSSTLNLTGLTTANSGTRYRAAASATGAATVNSQSATLTVTG